MVNLRRKATAILLALGAAAALLGGSLAACGGGDEGEALKIGLLVSLGDEPSQTSIARRQAFELAIRHVNEGGGVLGRDVELVVGDTSLGAAEEAQRLVREEGVHAIVGPSSSANSLLVIRAVLGSYVIPIISPSASSPRLSVAVDGDLFFRTVLSDASQGPVLAQLTERLGFTNVGVIYRNDAWGQGLSAAFADAWEGTITSVSVEPGQPSYLDALRQSALKEPEALVLLTFGAEGEIIAREAIENGFYDQFLFGDALRRPELIEAIGTEHLGGMYGVAGAHEHGTPAADAWEAAVREEFGEVSGFTYIREAYDAAIVIALAAEAAGTVEGLGIRDHLRVVASGPGEVVVAGPEGVARALAILRDGGAIDYDGPSGTIDWDENGDVTSGTVGVWRFTEAGGIEDVEVVVYEQ